MHVGFSVSGVLFFGFGLADRPGGTGSTPVCSKLKKLAISIPIRFDSSLGAAKRVPKMPS